MVIAGGAYDREVLRSTEVLDLATRKITHAGDMISPRSQFHIVTISIEQFDRVLAIAGQWKWDGPTNQHENSVEEFDPDTLTWKTPTDIAPANIVTKRGFFGAVAAPRNLFCPE